MKIACSHRDAYLAKGLAAEEAAAFEAHVTSCEACGLEVRRWRAFGEALTRQLEPARRPPTPADVAALLRRADQPRSQPWGPLAVVALAAALLVLVGWNVRAPSPTPSEPPELAAQPWSPSVVASNEVTSEGNAFTTSPAGRALLRLGDDELGLGAATRLEVASASTKATTVRLVRGVVAAHVNPARGARQFDVETPLGRVHVVGTVFRVRVREHLEVDVIRGVVEVTTAAGQRARLEAGSTQRFDEGAPVPAQPFEAQAFEELEAKPPPVLKVEQPQPAAAPKPSVAPIAEWRTAASRGGCAKVMTEAQRWTQRHRDDADVWLLLGDCRRRAGALAAAVDAYVSAAKSSEPQGKRGLLLAASLLQSELKQPARAITLVDQYVRSKPESRELEASALVRKALSLRDLGRLGETRAVLRDVVKRYPETSAAAEALRLGDALPGPQ